MNMARTQDSHHTYAFIMSDPFPFLFREMESLGERLNEATGTTHAQIELNKKRESEVTKLRKDLEECRIQQDATCASLKKKQQDAVNEMSEQCEQLSKMKAK